MNILKNHTATYTIHIHNFYECKMYVVTYVYEMTLHLEKINNTKFSLYQISFAVIYYLKYSTSHTKL